MLGKFHTKSKLSILKKCETLLIFQINLQWPLGSHFVEILVYKIKNLKTIKNGSIFGIFFLNF